MKNHIFLIILLSSIIGTAFYTKYETESQFYPASYIVTDTDEKNDLLYLTNSTGYTFTWSGIEDWQVGDQAVAIMNNNDTLSITDDIIVKLHYTR